MKITCNIVVVCAALTICAALSPASEAATNLFSVVNNGFSAFTINGVNNPNLPLVRGFTYHFQINALGHPFWIKSIQGNTSANAYTNGVSGNGTQVGTLTFTVPTNAPSLLFYNCEIHPAMTGQLNIQDPPVIHVRGVNAGTNLMLTSTGTDALNIAVKTSSSLVATSLWAPATILSNAYSNGTNITFVAAPTGSVAYVRVLQRLP